jgi:DNA-binding LacI/PurR family transcriptional regulator
MEENNGEVDEELIVVDDNIEQAVRDLMTRRPDVTEIYCVHDDHAITVMRALQNIGLRVPEDVSVIGLDNSAQYISADVKEGLPELTSVGFSHYKIGSVGAKLLLQKIDDPDLSHNKIYMSSHLIERDSCAKPRE